MKTGAEGDSQSTDVMELNTPDDLSEIAHLGLSLARSEVVAGGGSNSRSSPLGLEPTHFSGRIVDVAAVLVRSRTIGST